MEKTEPINEFFAELQRTRESKGLRLEDIAKRYRIRLSFLESIESGRFEDLPEPVYTRTFIKTYADLLGVDAGPIQARYTKHVEQTRPAPAPEVQPAKEPAVADAGKALMDRIGGLGSRVGWAAVAVVVVVVLGIYAFQDKPTKPAPARIAVEEAKPPEKPAEVKPPETPPVPPPQQPEAAPQTPPQQAAAPEPQKPEAPAPAEKKVPPPAAPPVAAPPAATGPLSLTIEATEAAWVQVKADKAPAVQKLMQAGEKLTTGAKDRITVDLGNAGGVQITFQGQSLGSPGKRGEVLHLVYPEGKRVERKKPEEPKPAAEAAAPQQ